MAAGRDEARPPLRRITAVQQACRVQQARISARYTVGDRLSRALQRSGARAGPGVRPPARRPPARPHAAGRDLAATAPCAPGPALGARDRPAAVRDGARLPGDAQHSRREHRGRPGAARRAHAQQPARGRRARIAGPDHRRRAILVHIWDGVDRGALPLLRDDRGALALRGLGAVPARRRLRGHPPRRVRRRSTPARSTTTPPRSRIPGRWATDPRRASWRPRASAPVAGLAPERERPRRDAERAYQKARESEEHFRSAFAGAPIGMALVGHRPTSARALPPGQPRAVPDPRLHGGGAARPGLPTARPPRGRSTRATAAARTACSRRARHEPGRAPLHARRRPPDLGPHHRLADARRRRQAAVRASARSRT